MGGVLLTGTPPFKPRFWLGLAPPPPCTHARCRRLESARVLAVGASGRSRRDLTPASGEGRTSLTISGAARPPASLSSPASECPSPHWRCFQCYRWAELCRARSRSSKRRLGPVIRAASARAAKARAPPTHKRIRAGGGRLPGGAPGQVLWAARGLIIPPDLADRVEAKIAGGRESTDSTASSAALRGGCRRLGPAMRSGRALRQSRRGPVAPSVLCMRPAAHRSGLCGPGRANRQQLLRPPADLRLRLGRSLSESA